MGQSYIRSDCCWPALLVSYILHNKATPDYERCYQYEVVTLWFTTDNGTFIAQINPLLKNTGVKKLKYTYWWVSHMLALYYEINMRNYYNNYKCTHLSWCLACYANNDHKIWKIKTLYWVYSLKNNCKRINHSGKSIWNMHRPPWKSNFSLNDLCRFGKGWNFLMFSCISIYLKA